ncbi:serine/arginine repetitive matrix protein 2-like [Schistocerca americana]|uniref:serine/arginine repetitive matrix protein 2-like n=1 Tax=Schistocerca americana TaxID=7009 RepID=UPI001F4F9D48|nr:serine/arginine repetitive matrix protein 2-like [Schistocerca americana]
MDSLNHPCPDGTGGPSRSQHTNLSGSESDTSCYDHLPAQGQSEAHRPQDNDPALSESELEPRTPRVRSAKTAASETLTRTLADTSESESEKERKAKLRKQKKHLRKVLRQRSKSADAATELMPPPRQPAPRAAPRAAPKAGDKPKPAQVAERKPGGPVGDGETGKSEPKAKTKASRPTTPPAGNTPDGSELAQVAGQKPGGPVGAGTSAQTRPAGETTVVWPQSQPSETAKKVRKPAQVARQQPGGPVGDSASSSRASTPTSGTERRKSRIRHKKRKKNKQPDSAQVAGIQPGGPVEDGKSRYKASPSNLATIQLIATRLEDVLELVDDSLKPGQLVEEKSLGDFRKRLRAKLFDWAMAQSALTGRVEALEEEMAKTRAAPTAPPKTFAQVVAAPPSPERKTQAMITKAQTEKATLFIKSKSNESGAEVRKKFTSLVKPEAEGVKFSRVTTSGPTLIVDVASETDRH